MDPLNPSNQTSEYKPIEEAKEKSKKFKWIFLGVTFFVIAIGALCYYFFFYNRAASNQVTSSDETSSWPVYENLTYGYSVKYRNDFTIDEDNIAKVRILEMSNSDATLNSEFEVLEINAAVTKGDASGVPAKGEKYTIAGREGMIYQEENKNIVVLFADEVKYTLIQKEISQELFEKIVKTFKLIARKSDLEESKDTEENVLSQTYTNEDYQYLLKYPKDWIVVNMNANKEESTYDQRGFEQVSAPEIVLEVQVSKDTLEEKKTAYINDLEGAKIISEDEVAFADQKASRIISEKEQLKKIALFTSYKNRTYQISGLEKYHISEILDSFQFIKTSN